MADFELPVTGYAVSGDVNIAYQTKGTGPVDIITVSELISYVAFMHEALPDMRQRVADEIARARPRPIQS